jgi:hypothetical protein
MNDALNLRAAETVRALADVLDKHPGLPEPVYISINLRHDGSTPHADLQFSSQRTPAQNTAAVAAWHEALGTEASNRLSRATVCGVSVRAYHPDYPADPEF